MLNIINKLINIYLQKAGASNSVVDIPDNQLQIIDDTKVIDNPDNQILDKSTEDLSDLTEQSNVSLTNSTIPIESESKGISFFWIIIIIVLLIVIFLFLKHHISGYTCKKYCYDHDNIMPGPQSFPNCKESCTSQSENKNSFKNCQKQCLSRDDKMPMPKCEFACIGAHLEKCKNRCTLTKNQKLTDENYKYGLNLKNCKYNCSADDYSYISNINLPNCKLQCNTTSKDINAFQNCEENCSSKYVSSRRNSLAPLPKCKEDCYTSSSNTDSLKNCEINCGWTEKTKDIIEDCNKLCNYYFQMDLLNGRADEKDASFSVLEKDICLEDCQKYNKYYKPTSVPLPKCRSGCLTTSKDKNALINCESRCGDSKKKYGYEDGFGQGEIIDKYFHSPVSVPLPKCKESCHTTSKDINALINCEFGCGSEENPVSVPLPKCRFQCFTTYKEPLKNKVKIVNIKK